VRRCVFIDAARLIDIVLFCTDASAIGCSDYCLRNFQLAGLSKKTDTEIARTAAAAMSPSPKAPPHD
jgi:hypothetical protein